METVPNKKYLKDRFKKLYPKKRLLAVQLDGFSHSVIFDSGNKQSAVIRDSFSHCMPEGRWSAAASAFFSDIGNSGYQNNAREVIFLLPNER